MFNAIGDDERGNSEDGDTRCDLHRITYLADRKSKTNWNKTFGDSYCMLITDNENALCEQQVERICLHSLISFDRFR